MTQDLLQQAIDLCYKGSFEGIANLNNSNYDLKLLHKIMVSTNPSAGLYLLEKTGFIKEYIPEAIHSINFCPQEKIQYKAIWPHTLKVISQTPKILTVRWAALFHDLGKPLTFKVINNTVSFHNHEYQSFLLFKKFANRSKIFSNKQFSEISLLIKNLGRIESFDKNWTDSAVRRLIKETYPFLDNLIILSKADITTQNPKTKSHIINKIEILKSRIKEIETKDKLSQSFPKGLGEEISKSFNIPKGPEIGNIKNKLLQKIKDGYILPEQDIFYYINIIKEHNVINKEFNE